MKYAAMRTWDERPWLWQYGRAVLVSGRQEPVSTPGRR
jgi:hypothetical protein